MLLLTSSLLLAAGGEPLRVEARTGAAIEAVQTGASWMDLHPSVVGGVELGTPIPVSMELEVSVALPWVQRGPGMLYWGHWSRYALLGHYDLAAGGAEISVAAGPAVSVLSTRWVSPVDVSHSAAFFGARGTVGIRPEGQRWSVALGGFRRQGGLDLDLQLGLHL